MFANLTHAKEIRNDKLTEETMNAIDIEDRKAAAHGALVGYEALRDAFLGSLQKNPGTDRRSIEVGLTNLMDAFDGLFSVDQVRIAAAKALVIGELAKAGRWLQVQAETDGFYVEQIAEAQVVFGESMMRRTA